ncbi:VWA domain-containing protein [Desulfothermus naphthae]
MEKKILLSIIACTLFFLVSGSAMASTSVAWTSPADGSVFTAGTSVTLYGQAAGQGQVGGTGLDLVFVLDSSGSMGSNGGQQAQQNAAIALVNNLPEATTSVGIVEFDSDANTVIGLTPLSSGKQNVINAINSVDAWGGTNIGAGVTKGASVLATASDSSRLQVMVVMSDGGSSASAGVADFAADNAWSTYNSQGLLDAIHSVGMGNNYSPDALKAVVDGPNDVYGDTDDYGTFVGANFNQLVDLFSGTGGNLVSLDHLDIQLPDGTWLYDYGTDGLGNFNLNYTLSVGPNTFLAVAYGTDNTSAQASITLYGQQPNPSAVPEPTTMLLLGSGLLGMLGYKRRNN